ncbi:sigma-70 family RNA polymerase sigma factor [Flavobacterium sp.]|uniref:RNA polymerase sigma factor n=1 Tax=Flavobacterium sp. TaxID=239 RepID=UPI00286E4F71|nr:sigma-70 family RNA polymerase sigma factor [Flavobacterium sp.]
MKTSDKELLEKIAHKNEIAFNEFYKNYSVLLYKWAYNRIGNYEVCNEVTQEFWSSFWINPDIIKTNEEGSAKNFLLHFFTYRILDYLRANNKRNKSMANDWEYDNLESTLSYSHILEEIHEKEIHTLIDEILDTLPALTKEVFICRLKKNYSIEETAAYLNIKKKTVYNRSVSGLKTIRTKVNEINLENQGLDNQTALLKLIVLLNLLN